MPDALYLSPLILGITSSIYYVICSPYSAEEEKRLEVVMSRPTPQGHVAGNVDISLFGP